MLPGPISCLEFFVVCRQCCVGLVEIWVAMW